MEFHKLQKTEEKKYNELIDDFYEFTSCDHYKNIEHLEHELFEL
jgi:hypothetical protein